MVKFRLQPLAGELNSDHRPLKLEFGAPEVNIVTTSGNPRLGPLTCLPRSLNIDLLRPLCDIGEDRDLVGQHLDEAATDVDQLLFSSLTITQDTSLKLRDERSVLGENTKLSLQPRDDDLVYLFTQDTSLRRDDFQIKFVCHRLHLPGRFDHFVNRALHVKGLFRNIIVLSVNDFTEATNRLFEWNQFARDTGKLLGNVEWL